MKKSRFTLLQIIVHIGGWIPLALILYDFFTRNLTANPIQAIEQRTGLQALTFLLLSLACTPVASIFGWKELIQRRKALGNYSFLYAALHVTTFFAIDYSLDLAAVWRDVWNKSYIIIGALAFLLLLPLAFTSFNYWMKRLGKNWKRLHKLVYIISPLVVVHFILVVKGSLAQLQGNLAQPLIYGGIALLLLILRIPKVKAALLVRRKNLEPGFQEMVLFIKKSFKTDR
ncbi:MAG: sulfoxide reductase heme-binding subunit YedZ [Chloroflexi bacterium]|nr:MAG: sulfoxide reductase heme-binding subunit YedZ [Chloroflexota bacterium]